MDRNRAHAPGVPEDWRETLAPFCPALRARHGLMPDAADALFMVGADGVGVQVLDHANECAHLYEFDHVPTARELAACHMAVHAPHN